MRIVVKGAWKGAITIVACLAVSVLFCAQGFSAEKRSSALGDLAPNIKGKATDGNVYSLDNLRGSFVFLVFWAVDCPVCEVELPKYEAFRKKYKSKNLKMLSVLINNRLTTEKVKELIKKRGYGFPVIPLSVSDSAEITRQWSILQTPGTYLINPEGYIVLRGLFGEQGLSLASKIITSRTNYVPPKIDFTPWRSPLGEVIKFKLAFPEVKPGKYHLLLLTHGRYVKESGELGKVEEVVPLTIDVKEKVVPNRVQAKIEKKSLDGKKAKMTMPEQVQIVARTIGNSAIVEVLMPVLQTDAQIAMEAGIYAKELGTYIPIGGGFPQAG